MCRLCLIPSDQFEKRGEQGKKMVTSPDKRGKKRSREWRDDTITCENAVTSILVRPSSAVSALEAKRPKWVPGTPKGVQTPIFLILDTCFKNIPRISVPSRTPCFAFLFAFSNAVKGHNRTPRAIPLLRPQSLGSFAQLLRGCPRAFSGGKGPPLKPCLLREQKQKV